MTVDRDRIAELRQREQEHFVATHPRSRALAEQAGASLLGGVPMNWMRRWPGPFPVFAAEASGATVVDVDGHTYVDLCLGDTGAMTGHSPAATVAAVQAQAARGITTMLPTADAAWVGEELARRFGLPLWQIAMTATDANRFALRLARHATGRPKVLVFNYCYHGSVDESLAVLKRGRVRASSGNVGPQVDPSATTEVVEFNDVAALEAALATGEVAAVLAEPALTNIGIVHPEPGYHDALRRLTRDTGTLLIIDETHTICVGPGGATAADGLEPDLFTIGKPIGGGIPVAAFGMTHDVAARVAGEVTYSDDSDISGVGGTLSGNALALAAVRATLGQVLTAEAYDHTIPLAQRWADGVAGVIDAHGLPWHVHRLGCRAEYWFCPPPRNGGEAAAAVDHELDALLHLFALNRGILLTPFHNMALMCPATTEADVDRHTEVFAQAVAELIR
ncbi:MAG: aspartate aminotransferase family protein [Acidimicrobiales bacterium]|jgi:glutamate-1-semialdehyde 2,1-aminomutase|nr:aspartate aminotransferase family protein [Acidimicrobiales bacterium]